MRMPVWKLWEEMCCAKVRICFMPMEVSGLNSTQIVPIEGGGLGFEAVGGVEYFSSMAAVGRAEKVIFLRLEGDVLGGGFGLWTGMLGRGES